MTENPFDTDRAADHVRDLQGNTHLVEILGELPLRIDDLGETVQAPMRMVWSDELGIALELGPYSISIEDAAQLRVVLDTFLEHAHWATGSPEQTG